MRWGAAKLELGLNHATTVGCHTADVELAWTTGKEAPNARVRAVRPRIQSGGELKEWETARNRAKSRIDSWGNNRDSEYLETKYQLSRKRHVNRVRLRSCNEAILRYVSLMAPGLFLREIYGRQMYSRTAYAMV